VLGKARPALLVALLAWTFGCATGPPKPTAVRVGHHLVHLTPPAGWEHLDHGREQLFRERAGELEISLADLGPASRRGLALEIEAARGMWLAGHRKDAFERVRELHGPTLAFAPGDSRTRFWSQWNEVTYLGDHADSATVARGFQALVDGTRDLAPDSLELMSAYALETTEEQQGREIVRQERRTVNGATWSVTDTWGRVAHGDRRRIACLDDGGFLLVLRTKRGPVERTGLVFEGLLQSIAAEADTTGAH
jgi:hypothetical protein